MGRNICQVPAGTLDDLLSRSTSKVILLLGHAIAHKKTSRVKMNGIRDLARSMLPEKLLRAQQVIRRAPIYRRTGVIFVHIPKNAGFAINLALYGRFMGHYTSAEIAKYSPGTWRSFPSFALTRNPWARCLSAYRFAIQPRGRTQPNTARISNPSLYAVPEFGNFDSFVKHWLQVEPLNSRDQVFRSQSSFITNKSGDIMVNFVGRVEHMSETTNWLSKTMGRDLVIGHHNATGGLTHSDYRAAFTDETTEIVGKLYEEDIRRFNYSF